MLPEEVPVKTPRSQMVSPEIDDHNRSPARTQPASALEEVTRLLNERIKELACVHAVSALFDRREATVEDTLQAIVEVIPRAWQHPDVAEACITLGESAFQTAGYRDSEWRHSSPIVVQNEVVGGLTVCYREERLSGDQEPFLPEEIRLLGTIAQRVSSFVERRFILRSLLSYQEDLRRMASELSLTEQRERRRIAEGLHDRIGQNLALATMRLGAAQQAADESEVAGMIAEAREILADIITETRTLTFDLCPPVLYELGLAAALDWLAEQFETTYGIRAIVRSRGGQVDLPEDVNTALFQATREALTNVGRHARATTVNVDVLSEKDRAQVVVEDNGVGFDVASLRSRPEPQKGFGLFSIRERLRSMGGSLDLESEPGRGTIVRLIVPLAGARRSPREDVS